MKILSLISRITGITKYGKKVGRTAANGNRTYIKKNDYDRIFTTLDKDQNVKKTVQKFRDGSYTAQDIIDIKDKVTTYKETIVGRTNNGKVITKDVTIKEKSRSKNDILSIKNIKWLEQSKTAINKDGDIFTVRVSAKKPTGKGEEEARLLHYSRYPLATQGWWQWFVNGKAVSSKEFMAAKTADIKKLI